MTDAEWSALALAESVTRLADRADPVPDDVWDEAARDFDEVQLGALVLSVATTDLFNRLHGRDQAPRRRGLLTGTHRREHPQPATRIPARQHAGS